MTTSAIETDIHKHNCGCRIPSYRVLACLCAETPREQKRNRRGYYCNSRDVADHPAQNSYLSVPRNRSKEKERGERRTRKWIFLYSLDENASWEPNEFIDWSEGPSGYRLFYSKEMMTMAKIIAARRVLYNTLASWDGWMFLCRSSSPHNCYCLHS